MIKIQKIIDKIKKDKFTVLGIFLFAIFSATTFELFNRPWGEVTNLWIPFDDKIPFIKELIIVYHTFMPMIIITGIIIFYFNKEEYKKISYITIPSSNKRLYYICTFSNICTTL